MKTNDKFKILEHILRNLHRYCIGISIISLIFICVDEKLIPGFIPRLGCINPDGVNGVVSIIGCSFIAAYIFYLLTCAIPNYVRRKEINELILKHFKNMIMWVDVCKEPIGQLNTIIKNMSDDEVYYPQDKEYKTIEHQVKRFNEEAKPLILNSIQPIYRYFTYLTPCQQKEIEEINNSMLFIWSDYLKDKKQVFIKEVKIMISHYDDLKNHFENLSKSVQ